MNEQFEEEWYHIYMEADDEEWTDYTKEDLDIEDPEFECGVIKLHVNLKAEFEEAGLDWVPYVKRHLGRDWGDQGEDGRKLNDWAITNEYRILSMYETPVEPIHVETDATKTLTWVRLARDY